MAGPRGTDFGALAPTASPAAITLAELLSLRHAGEQLVLGAKRVRAGQGGGHLSPFKGRGMEFDEARPYQAGDDLRSIHWRVTARTGKPYTKVFREERDRPVIVWLDLRRPMMFASRGAYKAVRAAQLAALVSFSAAAHGDRLGGLVFAEDDHFELRPRLGRRSALRLLQTIVTMPVWNDAPRARSGAADTGTQALLRLSRVARPGSLVFLLSDFRGMDDEAATALSQLARHSDLVAVFLYDELERELPPAGRYRIQVADDAMTVDTSHDPTRAHYRDSFAQRQERMRELVKRLGIYLLDCATTDDPRLLLANRFGAP